MKRGRRRSKEVERSERERREKRQRVREAKVGGGDKNKTGGDDRRV